MINFDKNIIHITRKVITKHGFIVIDLFSVGVFAYVAATGLNQYLFSLIDLPPVPPVQKTAVALATPKSPELKDFMPILKRNLFDPDGSSPSTFSKERATLTSETTMIPITQIANQYKLTGTVVGAQSEYSKAMLEDKKTGEQTSFRLGGEIQEGIKIVAIRRFSIHLDNHGRREVLNLDMEDKLSPQRGRFASRKSQPVRQLNPNEKIVRTGQNSWLLDRRYVESELNDMSRLITDVRAVPNLTKDGTADGFKLFAIRRGSLFSKIGLRNGDVVRSVNGLRLNSIEEGLETFQALRHEDNLSIEVVRNKQAKTLTYNIQ